ncbi:MAG TPA: cation:proton antiporter [Polyangium sp.]|nr:cation:proton antiporter [Polyangium sp.]
MTSHFHLFASSAVGSGAEDLAKHLFLQIVVILCATQVVVWISRRFLGQTNVAGEILAGIVLGPSVLGALAPDVSKTIFHPSTSSIFVGLAQLALVLLMFQIGMEFEFGSSLVKSKKSVVAISLTGILFPFALGYFSAPWFHSSMAEPRPNLLGFRLFFAIAMSITAIPILGRIFMELRLSRTRIAALTIGAAAVDDICGWLLLGVVSAIVTSNFSAKDVSLRLLMLAGFLAVVFGIVRKPLARFVVGKIRQHGEMRAEVLVVILLVLFLSALATSYIGVFAIIGGFIVGVSLHQEREIVEEWKQRMSGLVNTLLLPLFFTYTGLRTDIGTLSTANAWLQCGLVCTIAFAGKLGGAYVAARACGEEHRHALAIGVCMNTRALMELIALNIGYDLGVLPRQMYTMLVIMALISTYMATPLIRWLMLKERAPDDLRAASTEPTSAPLAR